MTSTDAQNRVCGPVPDLFSLLCAKPRKEAEAVLSVEPKVPCTAEALRPIMRRYAARPPRLLLREFMALLDDPRFGAARPSDAEAYAAFAKACCPGLTRPKGWRTGATLCHRAD